MRNKNIFNSYLGLCYKTFYHGNCYPQCVCHNKVLHPSLIFPSLAGTWSSIVEVREFDNNNVFVAISHFHPSLIIVSKGVEH